MKGYFKKALILLIGGSMLLSMVGCGEAKTNASSNTSEGVEEGNKELVLPEVKDFMSLTTWNDDMFEAYIKPFWYTREVYNETLVFVGEEGVASLMYEPFEVDSVRSYDLLTNYVDGKDYVIEGRTIKRVKGSAIPYWEPEEYFLEKPNMSSVVITAHPNKIDEDLGIDTSIQRYLRYGEGTVFTSKQLAVTYRTNALYDGILPKGQKEKVAAFLSKLEAGQDVNIMIYGPSTGTGCNASGTKYGGNINPYMPGFFDIIVKYIEKNYNVKVNLMNESVGGWKSSDLLANYNTKIKGKDIDLMFYICPGSNDNSTGQTSYTANHHLLFQRFFDDYPEANLLVQMPLGPNEQSTWTGPCSLMPSWVDEAIESCGSSDRIAVSRIHEIVEWMKTKGKRGRDFLANNINHYNDFVLRVYVQCALKAMFGDDYVMESYK